MIVGEKELLGLSRAIITINRWNRLAIGLQTVPGSDQPAGQPVSHRA
jgi:hypothetical protein